MSTENPEIDFSAIQAEVDNLSDEQLAAEVLKVRVRQKVQQKKMQGSASHKNYQQKANAKRKALIALAKSRGLYDGINEAAEAKAVEFLATQSEVEAEPETEVEVEG